MDFSTRCKMNLGYACINMTMNSRPKESRVTTNRSMIRRTFDKKGLPYVSELVLQNCYDLESIMEWNKEVGINFFRLSSNIFPWASEYSLKDLPDYEKICEKLSESGKYALKHGLRLSFHPGPFNILSSPSEKVVLNTINDLSTHGEIMEEDTNFLRTISGACTTYDLPGKQGQG